MKKNTLLILASFSLFSILCLVSPLFAQNVTKNTPERQEISGNFTIIGPCFLENYVKKLEYPGPKRKTENILVFITADPAISFSIFEKSGADVAFGFSPLPEKRSSQKIELLKNPSHPDILSIQVGAVAALILTNVSNPLKGLTIAQIDAIFSHDRACSYPFEITRWGELGLSGPWTAQPIHLVGLTSQSLISRLMRETALCRGHFKRGLLEQIDSADVLMEISRDKKAIGFSGIIGTGQKAYALPIAPSEGARYFLPTDENILTGEYPLSRAVYMFLKMETSKTIPDRQKQFIKAVLAKKGQDMLTGYGVVPAYPNGIKKPVKYLVKAVSDIKKSNNKK